MESGDDASRRRGSPSAEDKTESANLRDLLRVKEDDGRNGRCRLTLSDVLSVEKRPPVQPTQTLLEIIGDKAVIPDRDGKNSWRQLRKKLRLHRASASCFPNQQSSNQIIAWNSSTELATTRVHYSPANRTPSVESSQPEISLPSNNVGSDRLGELNSNERIVSELADRRQRTIENTVSEPADRSQQTNEGTVSELGERNQQAAEEEGAETEQPKRMSLMALLAEVEGQMVAGGSVYAMDEGDDEGKEKGGREGYNYNNCCVCMVRHKGAAFIPCGHTFCRPCCRELWVQRGNCPLCNAFILEILDIF